MCRKQSKTAFMHSTSERHSSKHEFFCSEWNDEGRYQLPANTHDTRARNWRHKSIPFSGSRFRRRSFVPYRPTSGKNISGAKIKAAVNNVNDK